MHSSHSSEVTDALLRGNPKTKISSVTSDRRWHVLWGAGGGAGAAAADPVEKTACIMVRVTTHCVLPKHGEAPGALQTRWATGKG